MTMTTNADFISTLSELKKDIHHYVQEYDWTIDPFERSLISFRLSTEVVEPAYSLLRRLVPNCDDLCRTLRILHESYLPMNDELHRFMDAFDSVTEFVV